MYFKLAFRNAKRSLTDYLLYITTTVILLMFVFASNYVAIIAKVEAGFRTTSLPLLISMILIVLVSYINKFMLRQRSKEFANYILLGMKKKKVVKMFMCEFSIIGFLCFGICCVLAGVLKFAGSGIKLSFILRSLGHTFLYFSIVEAFSIYCMKRHIYRLEISELMIEKQRNRSLGKKRHRKIWGNIFFISISILILMLCASVCLPDKIIMAMISFVYIPLTFAVFAFYKWINHCISLIRKNQPESLYQKERLYLIAGITSGANTSPTLNGVFCMCLFLASQSFIFGIFMIQTKNFLFNEVSQMWMGFIQICLCVIFMVIYFSILSLQQMIELQQKIKELKIICYLGKSKEKINLLVMKQILIKLSFPAMMCFILLGISLPFLNFKLNCTLGREFQNFWLISVCKFAFCFFVLYILYSFIIYVLSRNIIKNAINKN